MNAKRLKLETGRGLLLYALMGATTSSTVLANTPANATSLTWTENSSCPHTASIFSSGATGWRTSISGLGIPLSANDGTIDAREVTDPAFGGQDNVNENLDTADIALLATHGDAHLNDCDPSPTDAECSNTVWLGMETNRESDPQGDCLWWTPEMYLGNTRTNYFDAFACNSLELTWTNDYQSDVAFGLHQWHGFAGTMGTGTGTSTDLDNYVNASWYNGAAYSWIHWETEFDKWPTSGTDVCGVSRTWGNSHADADTRRLQERYSDGTWSDPGWLYSKVIYFNQCDPPSPIPGPLGSWIVGWHP